MSVAKGELTISVLGPPVVRISGIPMPLTTGEAHLIALLVAAEGDGLDADALASGYWPEELPRTWRTSLRNAITRLNRKCREAGAGDLISKATRHRRLQVPVEAVDAWRLLAAARAEMVQLDLGLFRGEPFEGCEIGDRLRVASDRLQAARRDLLTRHVDGGGEMTSQLTEAALALGLGDLLGDAVLAPSTPPSRSRQLERLAPRPLLRPEGVVAELVSRIASHSTPGFLLHGESGVGKTTLAAEVARRLGDLGYHTAYAVAKDGGETGWTASGAGYGPFISGIRGLKGLLDDVSSGPNGEASATVLGRFVEHLEVTYHGRPLCLVVDNVQWLDPEAQALLTVLANADLDLEVVILAVGQLNQVESPWPSWLADLARSHLEPVAVGRLQRSDVEALIASLHESIPEFARHKLAEEVYRRSSGVPAVVWHFARSIDALAMALPGVDADQTGYPTLLSQLDDDLVKIGAAAAVMGFEFALDELCTVAGLEPDYCRTALDRLVREGHLETLVGTRRFRFPHLLLADAFYRRLSDDERRTLHLKAFNQTTDVASRAHHARQAHLLGAGPSASEVAILLVEVAQSQAGEGSFWRAAESFQLARSFDEAALGIEHRIVELECLERSGQPSRGLRWDLVTEANEAGRPDLALAAAASGLPDVEDIWGDANRVACLHQVDHAHLDHAGWIAWAIHLSRQLLLIGHSDAAYDIADQAFARSETADEQAQAWMAMNRARGWTSVTSSVDDLPWYEAVGEAELQQQVRQALAISRIATGNSRVDYPVLAEHVARTRAGNHRSVHWFALLFQATAAADQGLHDEASQLANEARQHGLRHGITIAPDTHLLQNYTWIYHSRQHALLYELLEADRASHPSSNLFYLVGLCATRFAHALDDPRSRREAAVQATMLVRQAQDSQFASEIVGLLAPALAVADNSAMRRWAVAKLESIRDSYLLVGSAVANLGPGANIIAQLTPDRTGRIELHEDAIARADRHQLALWQVACRADLAVELAPDDCRRQELIDEAQGCATTDWLRQVLSGRLAWGARLQALLAS